MIALDAALAAFSHELPALPAETIRILDAANRVLAAPLHASTDLPRIDQSAMDGYALRATDTAGASSTRPLRLPVTRTLAAGAHENLHALDPGTAARIFTGAPIPPGADAVIPQERVAREGDVLMLTSPCAARDNIRWRGEELRRGATVGASGQRITPGLLASLINAGIGELGVHRVPRLRLLVTGDEIRPAGSPLAPGEIPDSNGPLVRALLARWGYPAPAVEYVADTAVAVREALERALADADLVVSCGGASVGDRDFVVAEAAGAGLRRVFWRVAQKPGKPLFFGVRETAGRRAALLALPGNPGAVLIGMSLHVRRALEVLEGVAAPAPHWRRGVVAAEVGRDAQRTRLLRMQLDQDESGRAVLRPLPGQDSHMLGNLAAADVLVRVEAGSVAVAAGERLAWIALDA